MWLENMSGCVCYCVYMQVLNWIKCNECCCVDQGCLEVGNVGEGMCENKFEESE